MKKVSMVVLFTLVTMASFSQNKTTIGFMGGFGLNSSISANYGLWADFGKWGGSFTNGASLSNEDPTDYIYGNTQKYTAGSSYYNIGVHKNGVFNNENVFAGGGIQRITNITTNGFEEASTLPYVNVGIKKEILYGVIRAEVIVSKIPSIGIGWGFKF
jgi:hypothetical protein